MDSELWREIPGFEGYEVSNQGVVRTNKLRKGIMKTRINNDGYEVVEVQKDKQRYFTTVHRLVALAFIPNRDDKPEVNHIDGVKENNTVSNLEWVSKSENALHRHHTLGKTSTGKSCMLVKDGIEHSFETRRDAMRFIPCCDQAFYKAIREKRSVKGWTIKIL